MSEDDLKRSTIPFPTNLECNAHQMSSHQQANVKTNHGYLQIIWTYLSNLNFEISVFSIVFFINISTISSTSMILEKACLVHLKYDEDVCKNLMNHSEIKSSVERLATNYQLGRALIKMIPSAFLALFVGSWSDQYGRKLPFQFGLVGLALDTFGSALCSHFQDSRLEYYLIPPLFLSMLGGIPCLTIVVYSYTSELSSRQNRTMKYVFYEITAALAHPLGAVAGGWIQKYFGYTVVFVISGCGVALSLLWITFLLPETRGIDNKDNWKVKIKNLFKLKSFKQNLDVVTKKRPHQGRRQIVFIILHICISHVSIKATSDIDYIYAHHQFDWDNAIFSTFSSLYMALTMFALVVAVPLLKHFKFTDPKMGLVGSTSLAVKFTGIGLSWRQNVYHVANVMGLFQGCATVSGKSCLSKVVSEEEMGRAFSFVAISESILPIITSVIVTQIFNAFLDTYPGMPYVLLASIQILPFLIFLWISRLPVSNLDDAPD